MALDVKIKLSDIGLFKRARTNIRGETLSQYARAEQIRDQFAHCMENAERNGCCMPDLCASGYAVLHCAHLHVDYSNFTGHGIPLTKRSASIIDSRLRAIGTQVYRQINRVSGPLPGDIHLPALKKTSFPGQRTKSKSATHSPPAVKAGGFFGRLLGF